MLNTNSIFKILFLKLYYIAILWHLQLKLQRKIISYEI